MLDITFHHKRVLLANIYAPNSGPHKFKNRKQVFQEISDKINDFPEVECVVLGGDFNCVLDTELDRSSFVSYKEAAAKHLNDLLERHNLEDIWRTLHPTEYDYTFHSGSAISLSCIDRFYTSRSARGSVKNCSIMSFPLSDHRKVVLTLDFSNIKTGPGVWQINTSILKEKTFLETIDQFWDDWKSKKVNYPTLLEWWDEGKIEIINLTKKYCASRAKLNRSNKCHLYKQLRNIDRKASKTGEKRYFDLSKKISAEIKTLELNEAEGVKVRAKAKWAEKGEKVTKYFCNLEKKRQGDRHMKEVRNKQGQTVTEPMEICHTVRQFYEDLYSAEQTDPEIAKQIFDNVTKHLSENEREVCEGAITKKELGLALLQMQNGKSPGIDGLPCEFYKTFWQLIGDDFTEVVNQCFEESSLTSSQRFGLITCLFKKGDRTDLQNWRPISLLNADYKIMAKTLANRLAKVIEHVVADDQTCAIPGRTILSTCHSLRNIIDLCEQENLPVGLLSIDQMKAFDRVGWNFLFKTLEKFGFGTYFCTWVKILYTDIVSAVKVNGYVSDTFSLGRGVRQGCPLSAPLYVLIAEIFAENIRRDKNISGIVVNKQEFKILQYADDTTLVLRGDKSIQAIKKHISDFEKAAGAKININKSEGIWLGSFKGRTDRPLGFKWHKKSLKILGIFFGTENTEKLNWEPKISKFNKILNLWKSRDLSFRGRAVVINQLASSVLCYTATIFPMGDWVLKRLNTSLWDFFYNGKKDLISRTQAKLPYKEGGLNVVDIDRKAASLRLSWFAKLFNAESKGKWTTLFHYFLGKLNDMNAEGNTLKCFLANPATGKHPNFFRATLKNYLSLCDNKRIEPTTPDEIYNEPLFRNSLLSKDRLLADTSWAKSGVTLVRDICYETVPGFLPRAAVEELVGPKFKDSTYENIMSCMPQNWKDLINTETAPPERHNPCFKISIQPSRVAKNFGDLKAKDLYNLLTHLEVDVTNQRFRVFWDDKFGKTKWHLVFQSLFTRDDNRKACDLHWKIIQLVVPTAEHLFRHKIIDNPKCLRCNSRAETTLHLFVYCPAVQALLDMVKFLIENLNPDISIVNMEHFVAVGFAHPKLNKKFIPENAVRDTALLAIWNTRNKIVFDNEFCPLQNFFTNSLTTKIKHEYLLAKDSLDGLFNFQVSWCKNNVLASLSQDNTLIINI